MKYICDTCVLIDLLRGDENTRQRLVLDIRDGLFMSSVTYMELMVGAFNKHEVALIKGTFTDLSIIEIDARISILARGLIEQFAKSHGLLIPNALIAATSLASGLPLWTRNISDFRYIPDITLV